MSLNVLLCVHLSVCVCMCVRVIERGVCAEECCSVTSDISYGWFNVLHCWLAASSNKAFPLQSHHMEKTDLMWSVVLQRYQEFVLRNSPILDWLFLHARMHTPHTTTTTCYGAMTSHTSERVCLASIKRLTSVIICNWWFVIDKIRLMPRGGIHMWQLHLEATEGGNRKITIENDFFYWLKQDFKATYKL